MTQPFALTVAILRRNGVRLNYLIEVKISENKNENAMQEIYSAISRQTEVRLSENEDPVRLKWTHIDGSNYFYTQTALSEEVVRFITNRKTFL
jgi:hypothetical protein